MKAMLLAAGEGRRLQPLTFTTPKPLVQAGGETLIERHVRQLVAVGVTEIIVNLYHLGDQIEAKLGNGLAYGADIRYSREAELLETGGGLLAALPLLGDDPFIVISADVYADIQLEKLLTPLPVGTLGCLVLVDNPSHHSEGDFCLQEDGRLVSESTKGVKRLTYSGISLLTKELIQRGNSPHFPLRELLFPAIAAGELIGLYHQGIWNDVGTMDRLKQLRAQLED